MRLLALAASAILAFGFAACSSSSLAPTGDVQGASGPQSHFKNGRFIPVWSKYASVIPVELRPGGFAATIHAIAARPHRRRHRGGIYASTFGGGSILGYRSPNLKNEGPFCTVGIGGFVNDIAVDPQGYLIVPSANSKVGGTISVFRGPGMCGPSDGTSVFDPYGQPDDAASADAAYGTIVVGNIYDNSGQPGSISLCVDTTNYGFECRTNLTNPAMVEVASVALAKNGDCWASAVDASGLATLTYFKGCSGGGQQATGYLNNYYGGLDIDDAGNLVSISSLEEEIYVYKGCNPACTVVGGPFPMPNGYVGLYGHLDKKSKQFAVSDFATGAIDVYNYSPTNITYYYSFNNGLCASCMVEGVAFNPRSEE
jgi:hypothetical protein